MSNTAYSTHIYITDSLAEKQVSWVEKFRYLGAKHLGGSNRHKSHVLARLPRHKSHVSAGAPQPPRDSDSDTIAKDAAVNEAALTYSN